MPKDWMAVMYCKHCPSDSAEVDVTFDNGQIAKLTFTCMVCGFVTVEDYSSKGINLDGIVDDDD